MSHTLLATLRATTSTNRQLTRDAEKWQARTEMGVEIVEALVQGEPGAIDAARRWLASNPAEDATHTNQEHR